MTGARPGSQATPRAPKSSVAAHDPQPTIRRTSERDQTPRPRPYPAAWDRLGTHERAQQMAQLQNGFRPMRAWWLDVVAHVAAYQLAHLVAMGAPTEAIAAARQALDESLADLAAARKADAIHAHLRDPRRQARRLVRARQSRSQAMTRTAAARRRAEVESWWSH